MEWMAIESDWLMSSGIYLANWPFLEDQIEVSAMFLATLGWDKLLWFSMERKKEREREKEERL